MLSRAAPDHNHESERPAKRVRQACEPCRRKKSKCPGEKPVCSHCERLKQNCHYSDEQNSDGPVGARAVSSTPARNHVQSPSRPRMTSEPRLEDRVRLLEAQLLDVVAGRLPTVINDQSPARSAVGTPQQNIHQVISTPPYSELPSWSTINSIAQTYLTYCDSQPLPLFHRKTFQQTIRNRDQELVFAILALTLRFTDDATERGLSKDQQIAGYVEASRKIVSRKIFDGTVELSTIQCLCLLSLVDFTNGNTRRSSIHSSLAMNLAHNAGLTSETYTNIYPVELEERRRCFWSLYLLKRLHGADFGILDFTGDENFPDYPSTPDRPLDSDEREPAKHNEDDGKGIIAYALQLSQVWFKITKYARRRGKPSSLPPWSPQSEYSIALAEQMELETRMPYIHRFRPARFSQRSLEELNANRDYWGPWLFLQLVYHTSILLLNHPLLLSLRLRNFKSMIPEIFLQHTSDMVSSHASWVIRLIEMMHEKGFKVTDPFLGYCVAIVATIYLQESFVEDPEKRRQKKEDFHKCLDFVRGMGNEWPHVSRIAQKLSTLSETVSASHTATSTSTSSQQQQQQQTPTRSLLIDLSLFWEILEYSSASEVPGSARLLFGSSLYNANVGRGFASEIASTSPLPEPTRVEGQDFTSRSRGAAGEDGSVSGQTPQQQQYLQPGKNGASGGGAIAGQLDVPFVYSDEELAVLAESFFSQKDGFDAAMNGEWWNTGNL